MTRTTSSTGDTTTPSAIRRNRAMTTMNESATAHDIVTAYSYIVEKGGCVVMTHRAARPAVCSENAPRNATVAAIPMPRRRMAA